MLRKYTKYFVLSFSIISIFGNQFSYSQKSDGHVYRLIISSSMFQNAKIEDVEASTKILASEIRKDTRFPDRFEIVVCQSTNEVITSIKSNFDILYISPIEYLQLKKKFDIEPALISEIENSYGDTYYLVANENIKSIKELKDGTINILTNADEQPPTIWLDKLLRENKLPVKNKFFKQINLDFKTNNVVLPVFFKKVTAAIVTKSAFDLICELNPKIKKETTVILKSMPMVRALFCFDGRNNDTERKNFLSDYLQNLHKSNHGKQVLSLYMVTKILPYKSEYLNTILDLYK